MTTIQILLAVLLIYVAVGVVFAILFAWRGAARLDHNVQGTGVIFRLLIIPGAAALWPLLLSKWRHQ